MVEVTNSNILLSEAREPTSVLARKISRLNIVKQACRSLFAGALLLNSSVSVRSEDSPSRQSEKKEGALIIAGGGPSEEIDGAFLELAGGKDATIVVIPTASERADTPQEIGIFWKPPSKAHPLSLDMLHTRDRTEADSKAFSALLRKATGVWLSGGAQGPLSDAYRNTLVHAELRDLHARGGVIGGTSAGAAVMGKDMIRGGKPDPILGEGFGFLDGSIVEQHYRRPGRDRRLELSLDARPGATGIGLEESTAIVVRRNIASVIGSANVHHFSAASKSRKSSVLKAGDTFDLKTGEVFFSQKQDVASDAAVAAP